MRLLPIIILVTSTLALAYREIEKAQTLYVRHPIQSQLHDYMDNFPYATSVNEVRSTLLWRRADQSSPRHGKSSGKQSQVTSSPSASKPGPKTVADALPKKKSNQPSGSINQAQIENTPVRLEPAQSGIGRDSGGARSKSVSPERSSSPIQDTGLDGIIADSTHINILKNKPLTQAVHTVAMNNAIRGIEAADRRAKGLARKGKHEPPPPAVEYQALENAKMELRQTQRDANQKIDAAGKALHGRPARHPTTQREFDLANHAIAKADYIASDFAEAHSAAAAIAVQEGRWSDFSTHVKNERKSVARNNANKAFYGATKVAQQDQYNFEQVRKIDSKDPIRTEAIRRAVAGRKELKAARENYSTMYSNYKEARERFPGSSSSEDEEKTFR